MESGDKQILGGLVTSVIAFLVGYGVAWWAGEKNAPALAVFAGGGAIWGYAFGLLRGKEEAEELIGDVKKGRR